MMHLGETWKKKGTYTQPRSVSLRVKNSSTGLETLQFGHKEAGTLSIFAFKEI